ncbi:MAG TPA: hypothetical protein PKD75_11365 [Tepidiformaceae bacterium]|jgi:hypothetical protein|nr:hypothetical protein [Tepidiformaceae bacterium]
MVKWLAFPGGYGHLKRDNFNRHPDPANCRLRCDFELVLAG